MAYYRERVVSDARGKGGRGMNSPHALWRDTGRDGHRSAWEPGGAGWCDMAASSTLAMWD